jgi:dynein heavy chain
MRPDRMQSALMDYVRNYLGNNYVEQQPFDIFTAFAESTPQTPLFFVLFPGVDPTNDIEK